MKDQSDRSNLDEAPLLSVPRLAATFETAKTEETTPSAVETEGPVMSENKPAAPQTIEEIDTAPKAPVATPLPGSTGAKPAPPKREEPPANPLLLDPYEWNQCTITVGYSLLPDRKVSVSVHNHKDDPIIKEFPIEDVPLPTKITSVMATLQRIWPTNPVNATVVLLPKPENALERPIVASVRVSQDTPIVQEGVESKLPFPTPIVAMLEELKALMPERALKNIEKNAKVKASTTAKPAGKSAASKQNTLANAPLAKNSHKDQMTLF